jgi:uncharacterized protein
MADETAAPVDSTMMSPADPSRRIESLDVVRGVAVLGIFAMNVATFAMPFAAYANPTVMFEYSGLNRATYWVVHLLFDLKMMSIFSMLFGAGAVMFGEKAGAKPSSERATGVWLRRMAWLFVIGMAHAYLVWEGDILVAYALCGAIVVWWLRRLSVRLLLLTACFLLLINVASNASFGWWIFVNEHPEVAIEQMGEGYEGVRDEFNPSAEKIGEFVATYRGDWATIAAARAEDTLMIQTWVFLTYVFWRASAMMLIGAALYKLGVFQGSRSGRFYLAMALFGYVVGFGLTGGGIVFNEAHGFDFGYQSLVGTQFNFFGSIAVALGHVGLVVGLCKAGVLGVIGRALASVGRMALTNYLMQSVIGSLVFYGYGLGMYGSVDRVGQQAIVAGVWAAQLVWSPWWLSRFRFGPAEWAWRSLTYWRLQPMRAERAI